MDLSERARDGTDALVARLEPTQRAAVLAREPVVCVLAGAGTGKTRVLTLRVARRVEDGSAHPSHVLVCTFSRKAAAELRQRLWGLGVGARVDAGTLHRTALRLIARHRSDRGLAAPAILADRRRFLAELDDDASRARRGRPQPGAKAWSAAARVDAEIGWAKSRLVRPGDYEDAARRSGRRPSVSAARVADAYARYEAAKARRALLDLDDLVWRSVEVLQEDAAFRNAVRWWHRHLFVDEAQDLNEAQHLLLRELVGDEPDLFVVGDPDQSVYGWNGADPAILDRIAHEYEGTRVLRLRENHRCSPQVVGVAAAALGSAEPPPTSSRPEGPPPRIACMRTDGEEARWVARQVWLAHGPGRRWSSIAVLARTNAQLRRFADALGAERVPCRFAGADLGPGSDVAGPPTLGGRPEREAGRPARSGTLPPAAEGAAAPDAIESTDATAPCATAPDATAPGAADMTGATDVPGARARWSGHEGTPDAVVLSTFHRAKGLQWTTVFVTGLSDGLVPLVSARTRAAREEERRLLYVALTRAEDEIFCSWALHADQDVEDGTGGSDRERVGGAGAAGAGAAGSSARRPSPWLEAIEEAAARQRSQRDQASPVPASEHLARIRGLLVPAGSEPPPRTALDADDTASAVPRTAPAAGSHLVSTRRSSGARRR